MKDLLKNLWKTLTIPKILLSSSRYTRKVFKLRMLKSERAIKIQTTTPINQKIVHLCLTLTDTQLLDNTIIVTKLDLMIRWILVTFNISSRVSRVVSVGKIVVERRKLKNQLFMVKRYRLINQFPKKLKKDNSRKISHWRSRKVWSAKLNVMVLS